MTKEEALDSLRKGHVLTFESWEWSMWSYQCSSEYGCCYESFNTPEESLEHLEMSCDSNWDEVEEL